MTFDRRASGISDRRDSWTDDALRADAHAIKSPVKENIKMASDAIDSKKLNQQLVQANENLIIASIKCHAVAENLEKTTVQMTHLANHDFLTNLPNRMQLYDRISQAMLLAKRDHTQLAVLFWIWINSRQ